MSQSKSANGTVAGLDNVVAAETRLSRPDGQKGELIIAGYAVEELAARATFEEVVYLLWHGTRPSAEQHKKFQAELAAWRPVPAAALALLAAAAREKRSTMDALRMAAGAVDLEQPTVGTDAMSGAVSDAMSMAKLIVARLPTLVAAYWRMKRNLEPVAPNPQLGHAANYLYMLTGVEPAAAQVRGLETYLNTVMDHGLNASTFAARVIIATETDLVSAVVGAIGALKGPRHGGAPGPALDMVFEIGEPQQAEAYLRAKLARKELLMGFGHRVYKVRDPRAEVLAQAAEVMYREGGDMALYELAKQVETTAVALLAEYKPGRNLQTNVEFYTALLLHGLGLETELFTPTFAISRAAGWIAHCFEQQAAGRIIRPESTYVGEVGLRWN